MPWGAAIGLAGGVLGGLVQGDASRHAANTQADTSRYVANLMNEQFQQTRGDLAPFRTAGANALTDLSALSGVGNQGGFGPQQMAALTSNPAYQFNLAQGQQAIDKAAAARGTFFAPQTLQDIGKFSQGLASQEYGNIWNRLFNISGMGENAAAQTGTFGANAANAQGQALMGGANANAAGIMGQAGGLNQILGGFVQAGQDPGVQDWLKSLFSSGGAVPTSPGGYMSNG